MMVFHISIVSLSGCLQLSVSSNSSLFSSPLSNPPSTCISAIFLRPTFACSLCRLPDPLDDIELEELGSLGLFDVGKVGLQYGRISSWPRCVFAGGRSRLAAFVPRPFPSFGCSCASLGSLGFVRRSVTCLPSRASLPL